MAVVEFKLVDPAAVLKMVSGDPLGSPSIRTNLFEAALEPNLSFPLAAAELTLNPRGSLSVLAFNSEDDEDPDAILIPGVLETPAGHLPPQLAQSSEFAWLKYVIEAGVKASTARTLAAIGFNVEGGIGAVFTDYRRHDRSRPAKEAIALDMRKARFAIDLDDVTSLDRGDALAVEWRGTLGARVEISWSDLFTGPTGTLRDVLGVKGAIGLKLRAAASVAFEIGITDDFLVVFSRVDDARWRVGLRKARSRKLGGEVAAGITAQLVDRRSFDQIVDAALESVLARPLADVQSILQKGVDRLSDREKEIVTGLMKRVGLDSTSATVDMLRERVMAIQGSLPQTLREIATAKVALSFGYEYSRVDEHVNVIQAVIDKPRLDEHHPGMIRGQLNPIVAAVMANTPGIALETYLNQRTITTTRSWGFTLGIGKWVHISGKDFKNVVRTERRNLDRQVQQSYLGARGYKGEWVGETFEWTVDLKADMKNFSVHPAPLVTEFNFGLHLVWTAKQKKLSQDELAHWLDSGVLWGVVPEVDLEHARSEAQPMVGLPCEVAAQIVVSNDVFRTILPGLASSGANAYAPALAAAMPWWNVDPVRTSVARRRELYAPLWMAYLNEPDLLPGDFAHMASRHLEKQHHRDLAFRERQFAASRPLTFAGLVDINGNTRAACTSFTRGAGILQSAIGSGAPNQRTLEKAFETMNDLWTQSHHVRAMGAYVLDAAAAAGALGAVGRTLTITSGDDVVMFTA